MMVTKKVQKLTAVDRFKKEFAWVRKRLLEEFEGENVFVNYYDGGNCLGVGVKAYIKGKRRRNSIRLIGTQGNRFEQTLENEEHLEKFIKGLKA